ncbi:hypothetical protein [Flexivirga oryzae]|uniref:Uncharacterized protein n=1 Tax=Flexivirga oryzae TaxID=1794944 RepID=A0A839N486_9MICO|nr:hypothetical protein [Flexivirga oryzae]MBB2892548.1 hypothetical protein [Flexivirga oryzae]
MSIAHLTTRDPLARFVIDDPPVVSPEALEAARQEHLEGCADTVRSLRGQLVSTSAGRLRLVGATHDTPWTRLRQGTFAACDIDVLKLDERLILMALATQAAATTRRIYVHGTARAAWQLPAIGPQTELVEFARPPDATGRSPQARRRRTAIAPDAVDVGGLCVTGLERTIVDRARYESLESAVAMSDEALRRGLIRQADVLRQIQALPQRSRGCRMAELALLLADGRAESPLESLSRMRMFQLGLPKPELQAKFYDADGFIGRVDFFWKELGIIGEADGKAKYQVPEGATAAQAAEGLWKEKRREDRLRRHPDVQHLGRWGWDDAINTFTFSSVMTNLGVRTMQDGPTWPVPERPLPRKSGHVSVIERHTE